MTLWCNIPLLRAHKSPWKTLSQLDGMNIMTTILLLKQPGKHQITRVTFCQSTPLTRIHKSPSKTSSQLDGTILSGISLSQQRYLILGSRIQQSILLILKNQQLISPPKKSILWKTKKTTATGAAGYSLLTTMD